MITSYVYKFFGDMQLIGKKRENGSSRKSELKKQRSHLEGRVGGLEEQLEAAFTQLKVGCIHYPLRQLLAVHSHSVCARCQLDCCQYQE